MYRRHVSRGTELYTSHTIEVMKLLASLAAENASDIET